MLTYKSVPYIKLFSSSSEVRLQGMFRLTVFKYSLRNFSVSSGRR